MAGSVERILQYHYGYNKQVEHYQVLQNDFNNSGSTLTESSNTNNYHFNSQGPIGLTLKVSPSLINQIRLALNQETKQQESKLCQPNPKLKACSIPAVSFKIGSWKLKEQPQLCEETDFQAKRHTKWEPAKDDFTRGQASIYRQHTIACPPRVLDEPFKKLLQCDNHLLSLSQQPFTTYKSPYFDNQMLDFSCNTSIQGCSTFVSSNGHQRAIAPYTPNLVQPIGSCVGYSNSDLPMRVLDPPIFNQHARVLYCNQAWEQS